MSTDDFPERDSWMARCASSANDPERPVCADPQAPIPQSEIVSASRASALGEMAATLAQELNQPLAAIANSAGSSERLLASAPLDRAKIQGALALAGADPPAAGQIIRSPPAFVANDGLARRRDGLTQVLGDPLPITPRPDRSRGRWRSRSPAVCAEHRGRFSRRAKSEGVY
jgi:two-component system sensor kinase FixL